MQIPLWYIPTWHGDVKLEADGPERTVVVTSELTATEVKALQALRDRALKGPLVGKAWAKDFPDPQVATFRKSEQRIALDARIGDVQKFLARALKPRRKLLSAVVFKNGEIRETWRDLGTTVREDGEERKLPPEPEKKAAKEAKAAATVAAPVLGCPAPDFSAADARANRVLETFLTPDQVEDWRSRGRFVVRGHDTGYRYMLTSRENREDLARFGGRSLFSLDERTPFCTHDWDVPAAEELLALRLFLAMPGGEFVLRSYVPNPLEV